MPGATLTASKSPPGASLATEGVKTMEITELMMKLESKGVRCGCWYSGDETGFFSAGIEGELIEITVPDGGYGYVEATHGMIDALVSILGSKGALSTLAQSRRRIEDRLRKDPHAILRAVNARI